MKITKVEAILVRAPSAINTAIADGSQDGLLVRVHTDDGIVGIGEIDSRQRRQGDHRRAALAQDRFGPRSLLVGEDPLEIGRLWRKMYEGTIYFGRRGVVLHAISGVEIALWDIAGKAAGKPIHALLGGARRDQVKAYASTLMPDTPDEAARRRRHSRKAGFKAVKLGWGPLGHSAELDVALVAAARKAGGDDLDLMIDVGMGWPSARDGIDRVRRMEEYHPFWIEEPFWPDDYAKYAALAAAVDTPIAGGEEETTLADFERLVEKGNVEIVQPDVTRAGGISECLRDRRLRPAHTASAACCMPGAPASSRPRPCTCWPRWRKPNTWNTASRRPTSISGWWRSAFPVVDGFVAIPNGPGLGIELDEEALKEFAVR